MTHVLIDLSFDNYYCNIADRCPLKNTSRNCCHMNFSNNSGGALRLDLMFL